MKYLQRVIFMLAILSVIAASAAPGGGSKEKGIQFTEGNWQSVLKKAKAENKIIFFDAYATWCGPCKLLQKNVFTREDVAKVFNGNFINVKVDMESGEGPMLAQKYPLEGYPTLFFINGDGKVLETILGYKSAEELIKVAKKVQEKNQNI